jgi:hypothetical protein
MTIRILNFFLKRTLSENTDYGGLSKIIRIFESQFVKEIVY